MAVSSAGWVRQCAATSQAACMIRRCFVRQLMWPGSQVDDVSPCSTALECSRQADCTSLLILSLADSRPYRQDIMRRIGACSVDEQIVKDECRK